MLLSSVGLSVPSVRRTPLRRVCCCGPGGGQKISSQPSYTTRYWSRGAKLTGCSWLSWRCERALRRLTDLGSRAELAEVGQLLTGGAQVVSHGHVTSQLVLGRRAQPVDHLQRHQPHARYQLSSAQLSSRRRRRRRETIETFKT